MDGRQDRRTGTRPTRPVLSALLVLLCLMAPGFAPAPAAGATLGVEVQATNGQKLDNIYVEISSYSEPWIFDYGWTGDIGTVEFTGLPPLEDYVVSVDMDGDGYLDLYYSGKYQVDEADWIDLTASDGFVLIELGVLQGYITDSQGSPLFGVWVEAWTDTDYDYAGGVFTDFEGWYGFWTAPGKNYILSAWPAETGYYYSEDALGNPQTAYSWETATAVPPSLSVDYDLTIPGNGAIAGHVKDAGGYIEAAWVEAYDASTGAWGGTETAGFDMGGGEDYNYTILGLPPGTYTVSVYIDGDLQATRAGVSVSENGTTFVDFPSVSPFGGYAVSGTVTGLDLNEYAFISAWSPSKDYYGEVEVLGTGGALDYTIEGLFPAADYIVEIVPENHPYQAYANQFEWLQADLVDLSSGSRTGIDFNLGSGQATISGTITFPAPPPDGGVIWVQAESVLTDYWSGVEVVLDSGSTSFDYQIDDLVRLDDYVVSVWPVDYPPQYYRNTRYWSEAALVSTTDASATNIDFNLSEGTAISGRVILSGSGLSDAQVSVWSDETGAWGETYTGFDGGFTITGLEPADDFILEVWAPPYGVYYWNSSGTVRDVEIAGAVNTLPGSVSGLQIVLDPGEIILGQVENTRNMPLPGVLVSAWSSGQRAGNSTTTRADGTFTIQGLPASDPQDESSDYDIEIGHGEASDYCPVTVSDVATCESETFCGSSVEVILREKGTTYTLTGTVTGPDGLGVSGARVELWSPSTAGCIGVVEGFTDAGGNYSISGIIPSGDYELTVWPPPASSLGVYNQLLSIEGDGQWPVGLVLGRTFDGTVYLPGGDTPANNAWVFVYSLTTNYFDYTQTLTDGRYEIPGVPTGGADVVTVVFKEGYLVDFDFPDSPGDVTQDFTLALEGLISGSVQAGGTPVAGATLEVTLEDGLGTPVFWISGITDENGRFSISGLPVHYDSGDLITDYILTASIDGYPPAVATGLKTGDTFDFDLVRTGDNRLTGTVNNIGDSRLTGTFVIAHVYNVTDPNNITEWTWTEVDRTDGTFAFTGLRPNTDYAFRFSAISTTDNTTEAISQWEANGTGIVIPDTDPPTAASTHTTGESVSFSFDFAKKRSATEGGPGRVRNIRMEPRAEDIIQNLTLIPTVRISNTPNVTVSWDPTRDGANEKYYYVFNNKTDYTITKRNAKKPGITARRTTSRDLSADHARFVAHVAAEDNRGRIGRTEHLEFFVDTVAPQNPSVRMLNPEKETRSSGSVTLDLNAVNATQMYISNVNFGQGGEWETYTSQKKWKLPAGGQAATVYVLFRDEALNTSRTSMTVQTGESPLKKVISVLRVLSGGEGSGERLSDLDGVPDQVIDLRDAIFHLQSAAEQR